jgi:hypothetical protein
MALFTGNTRDLLALKLLRYFRVPVLAWPAPLSDGTILATRAKGIYKPNWTKYALSVRQTLNSPYHDSAPSIRPDGTWSYSYYQENSNPMDRDLAYTNRALLACYEDRIPVGVMRQISIKPQVRYHVVGLALVTKWEAGYFYLEGFSLTDQPYAYTPRNESKKILKSLKFTLFLLVVLIQKISWMKGSVLFLLLCNAKVNLNSV